ncbi:MAG: PVC-type heme-binding CxxCH protein [Pirellulales bacterium]
MPANQFAARTVAALMLGLASIAVPAAGEPACPVDAEPTPVTPPPAAVDYNRDETESRPAPAWVQMIDQGSLDPRLAGIHTPAGVRVEIVAEEPAVVNPVGIAFAEDGTPYVLEWRVARESEHATYEVQFRDGTTGIVNRMRKDVRDELKTLADTNGDGGYDEPTVIMDDLEIPSSLLLHDGWIYLSSLGHIVRRRPNDEGGWEEQELVRGLCGFHHHQASGMTVSPDGWLYITSGDDDNRGEGADGSRAIVLRTGAVFRCRPNGSDLHEVARGFRNPYRDVAFDHLLNVFHVDNDQEDGSKFQGVRLMHVAEGGDYGWRLAGGTICCRTDFDRGSVFGERPGRLPSMIKTGRGSPAGLLIYQGTAFPEFFRGLLIYPDVFRKMVRAYRVERAGSTFTVSQQFELMKSDDGLFRPCHAVQGPDGAIYIADWRTDSGGAGRLWGDGQHGRIYRLTWGGAADAPAIAAQPIDSWARIAKLTDDELWKLLDTPDYEIRRRVQRELLARGKADAKACCERFIAVALDTKRSEPARAMAAAALCQLWHLNTAATTAIESRDTLLALLKDPSFELRRLAAELIARNAEQTDATAGTLAALEAAISDPHPAVRRAAGLALGQVATLVDNPRIQVSVANALLAAWRSADSNDPYLRDGLFRGAEKLPGHAVERLTDWARSADPEDREAGVAGLESLRTPAAIFAYEELLDEENQLTSDQQIRLLVAYRQIQVEPPIDATPVGDWLVAHADADPAVKLAALETLAKVGGLHAEKTLPVVLGLVASDDAAMRLAAIRVIGDNHMVGGAPRLVELLSESSRELAERQAAVTALGKLRQESLPWGGKTPPGVETVLDPLFALVDEAAAADIRADLVEMLAAVDFDRARPVAEKLLDSDDLGCVRAAITALGANADDARKLGERFAAGRLDRQFLPQVAAALKQHAEKDSTGQLTALLAQVYKGSLLGSAEAADAARVESLVATTGDPQAGRLVFLNKQKGQCVTCHKLEGTGGQVGPDLTKVWETQSVAKLLEALLDPSKEIKEGYAAFTATTDGGQVYTGLKVSANEREVVLRDAQGKDITIPLDEIDELAETRTSLMPEGVVAQLSFQEFIDLVAFLKSREAQEALRDDGQK